MSTQTALLKFVEYDKHGGHVRRHGGLPDQIWKSAKLPPATFLNLLHVLGLILYQIWHHQAFYVSLTSSSAHQVFTHQMGASHQSALRSHTPLL